MLEQGKWNKENPEPFGEFHKRFEETLKQIEEMEPAGKGKAGTGKALWKKVAAAGTAVAAALAVFVGICHENPVWASELPLIGHVFERLDQKLSYGEHYEEVAEVIANENKKDDISVTISEQYYSGNVLYLSFLVESEEPFPEAGRKSELSFRTEETYSFCTEKAKDLLHTDGEFLDDHTYAGALYFQNSDFENAPDTFTMNLTLNQIVGYWDEPEFIEWDDFVFPNEQENWWYEGPWEFTLEISQDSNAVERVEIHEENEEGAGIAYVEKTPFELTIRNSYRNESDAYEYLPITIDAQGKVIQVVDNFEVIPIKGYDVSEVTICLVDYTEYMDELKGHWEEEGYAQLILDHARFTKTVQFK